ncbi:MAG: c-type cytochrome [Gallionellaceae bacterium]|nr:c-type cytochrome [Gallionellaceae bacterium]
MSPYFMINNPPLVTIAALGFSWAALGRYASVGLVSLSLASLVACGKLEPADATTVSTEQSAGITSITQNMVNASAEVVPMPTAVSLEEGLALAQKNNCLACHQLDTKLIGPAWRDVAKKYKTVAGSEHALVIKVATGGGGTWGEMPMPAMAPNVKDQDIRALVKFILNLEPLASTATP